MAPKNVKLYYSATEVAELLDEPVATIGYWEKTYRINAPVSAKGVKRYRPKEVEKLKQIRYLVRNKHLSRKGVEAALATKEGDALTRRAEALRLLERAATEIDEMLQMMDRYRFSGVKSRIRKENRPDPSAQP